jgi:hypothetical protein
MKKLLIVLVFFFFACSSDETDQNPNQNENCYPILSRGYDARGNFIIVKISDFNNKRYQVANYQDYIGVNEICDLSNLIEQPL